MDNQHREAYKNIYPVNNESRLKNIFIALLSMLTLILFLPWTQNINTIGELTTQFQEQRPQQINSIIPGKIIKWWIKEGDFVKKGDTLLELADTKDDYLDPKLIERTREQLEAKKQKRDFYDSKIQNLNLQIDAIQQGFQLKEESIKNKIQQQVRKIITDSADLIAATQDLEITNNQIVRAKKLLNDGIISLVEFEKRSQTSNKAIAVFQEKQQKYNNTKQDITLSKIELKSLKQETADKLYKIKSEIANSNSDKSSIVGDLAKNENQLSNYIIRGNQKWILAPQSGQIVKAKKSGINEMVKEGEMIVEIIPNSTVFAVELFIKPMDLALLNKGQTVRLQFDGYPAIVFSGWPKSSYGTFAGTISAVESNRNDNGKFRVLVIPDTTQKNWPSSLKIGTGVKGFVLLNNVTIGYELWRQLNGFPPDFYKLEMKEKDEKK